MADLTLAVYQYAVHILLAVPDNFPTQISISERMAVEKISRPISMRENLPVPRREPVTPAQGWMYYQLR